MPVRKRLDILTLIILSPFVIYHTIGHNWLPALAGISVWVFLAVSVLMPEGHRLQQQIHHLVHIAVGLGLLYFSWWDPYNGMLWATAYSVSLYLILSPRMAFSAHLVFLVLFVLVQKLAVGQDWLQTVRFVGVQALVAAFCLVFAVDRVRKERELRALAATDPLTRIANRREVLSRLQDALVMRQRYAQPVSLILLDIDHFKSINDRLGHMAGDQVLLYFVRVVSLNLRGSDLLGRLGGEEFIVVLRNTALPAARSVAEKVVSATAAGGFPEVGKVTVSAGVIEARQNEKLESCLRRADEAMYMAKHRGRNQVATLDN